MFLLMIVPLLVAHAVGSPHTHCERRGGEAMAVAIHLDNLLPRPSPTARARSSRSTLDIAAGETVVLLGPSGCGKTTTLRIIAGLESPDAGGRVLFDERRRDAAADREARNVGMVFQSYALFPNMTVAGEHRLRAARARHDRRGPRQARAHEMLELVRPGGASARGASTSSPAGSASAWRWRGRSPSSRACCCSTSRSRRSTPSCASSCGSRSTALLRRLGITAVYVTHDQAEAMALGDRIVVMETGPHRAGRHAAGDLPPAGAPRFVADFIGTMNRMRLNGGAAESCSGPRTRASCAAGQRRILRQGGLVFFLGDHTRLVVDCGRRRSPHRRDHRAARIRRAARRCTSRSRPTRCA